MKLFKKGSKTKDEEDGQLKVSLADKESDSDVPIEAQREGALDVPDVEQRVEDDTTDQLGDIGQEADAEELSNDDVAASSDGEKEKKDDEMDDLLNIFSEEDTVNHELNLLAGGLEEVNMANLAEECASIISEIRSR